MILLSVSRHVWADTPASIVSCVSNSSTNEGSIFKMEQRQAPKLSCAV